MLILGELNEYMSNLPLNFREFEEWIYPKVVAYSRAISDNNDDDNDSNDNNNLQNVLLKVFFGSISRNIFMIKFDKLTFSVMLENHEYRKEYYFIYDIKQKRIRQLPGDGKKQYLRFFKSVYEIFTRIFRLDPIKRKLINTICHIYTGNDIHTIIEIYPKIYASWKQHQHVAKFIRKLLDEGYFDKIVEVCECVKYEIGER